MLIPKRFWEPIQRGEVDVTFRRWKRPLVVAGRVYRTAAGRLEVESVDIVDPVTISDDDARRAGFVDGASVASELRGDPDDPVFRICFRLLDEPDPRSELANDADLTADDVDAIGRRLARLDGAAAHGPWTHSYMELIKTHPERRAPDLAAMVGRETQPFKIDVRKLKNMGLTLSFPIGYRLSPRGQAYLEAVQRTPGADGQS